jgi:cyanate permease
VGFLGAAIAAPLIAFLHEATGSLAAAMLVLAGVATVTLICAFAFPDREEELKPELWARAPEFARERGAVAQAAE